MGKDVGGGLGEGKNINYYWCLTIILLSMARMRKTWAGEGEMRRCGREYWGRGKCCVCGGKSAYVSVCVCVEASWWGGRKKTRDLITTGREGGDQQREQCGGGKEMREHCKERGQLSSTQQHCTSADVQQQRKV